MLNMASWEIPEGNGALNMDFPWPGLITGEYFGEMVLHFFEKNGSLIQWTDPRL